MPEIGPRHDKELIFFAILFVLNILCDIIHEVTDKHVYVSLTDLINRAVGNDWLQLFYILNNILINVLGAADMLYRNFEYMCDICIVSNGVKWSIFLCSTLYTTIQGKN